MFGFTLALFVHMCNGIRHLVWDAGYGFEIKSAQTNSVIVVVAAIALTIITFILGYSLR
jgi:succinate dehydrogenase / fumarate reductase cytochrome b subunit